ncbi:hypothetical protein ACV56Z_03280 [Staphylococcus aureus]
MLIQVRKNKRKDTLLSGKLTPAQSEHEKNELYLVKNAQDQQNLDETANSKRMYHYIGEQ